MLSSPTIGTSVTSLVTSSPKKSVTVVPSDSAVISKFASSTMLRSSAVTRAPKGSSVGGGLESSKGASKGSSASSTTGATTGSTTGGTSSGVLAISDATFTATASSTNAFVSSPERFNFSAIV